MQLITEQPYPGLTAPLPEGMHVLGIHDNRYEILVCFNKLTQQEIQDFRKKPIYLAAVHIHDLLVLLMDCPGSGGWMDAPFDVRLLPQHEQRPPHQTTTLMTFVLTDAQSGVVQAIRSATLSAAFMSSVAQVIEKQLQSPLEKRRYHQQVTDYQQRYQPSELIPLGNEY